MINVGHNLVCPNLPPGESLTGLNLKKVTGQGKYIYLLPSAELPKAKIPEDYYVSLCNYLLAMLFKYLGVI